MRHLEKAASESGVLFGTVTLSPRAEERPEGASRSTHEFRCSWPTSYPSDPRVDQRLQQIDNQIGGDEDQRQCQNRPLQYRHVSVDYRLAQ
jgi:hypothetical protein